MKLTALVSADLTHVPLPWLHLMRTFPSQVHWGFYNGIHSDGAPVSADVTPLLDWIRRYFDGQLQSRHTSVQERWQGATPVVITDRYPSSSTISLVHLVVTMSRY
ncbi:hypothetical protein B0F90DRAFT_871104 [Multifurca ochricompacta]|uniref:Uncharacterized protein n=1 Tax=Multifurca ochricompacta TaxID=376703 RepID=A0AAD4M0Y1_9AGAM|nr:hypothetical protein B0F90DRAFT_871104 [Multifurca ochricompacta]